MPRGKNASDAAKFPARPSACAARSRSSRLPVAQHGSAISSVASASSRPSNAAAVGAPQLAARDAVLAPARRLERGDFRSGDGVVAPFAARGDDGDEPARGVPERPGTRTRTRSPRYAPGTTSPSMRRPSARRSAIRVSSATTWRLVTSSPGATSTALASGSNGDDSANTAPRATHTGSGASQSACADASDGASAMARTSAAKRYRAGKLKNRGKLARRVRRGHPWAR